MKYFALAIFTSVLLLTFSFRYENNSQFDYFRSTNSIIFSSDSTKQSNLIGAWSLTEFNEGFRWHRTNQMKDSTAGFLFKKDGTLLKRHPKHWYEDPAFTFEDYPGTWEMSSPDVMILNYAFDAGRSVRESVFINSCNDTTMVWQRLGWEDFWE